MPKTRIKETSVMYAEFSHHSEIGRHLCGIGGRDLHGLPALLDQQHGYPYVTPKKG